MFDGPPKPELAAAERLARIRLARSRRVGPVTFHEALQHFGSGIAACRDIETPPESEIVREQLALEKIGGRFLVFGDEIYPEALAPLADAPAVLSAIGNIDLLQRPMLAIV